MNLGFQNYYRNHHPLTKLYWKIDLLPCFYQSCFALLACGVILHDSPFHTIAWLVQLWHSPCAQGRWIHQKQRSSQRPFYKSLLHPVKLSIPTQFWKAPLRFPYPPGYCPTCWSQATNSKLPLDGTHNERFLSRHILFINIIIFIDILFDKCRWEYANMTQIIRALSLDQCKSVDNTSWDFPYFL